MLLFISLAILLIALVAAIYNYKENAPAIYLSLILFIFSTYSLTHYFTIYGSDPFMLAIFYGHFSPLWFLIGPFIFFYTRSLYEPKKSKIFWTDIYHFIPFFLHFISVLNYFFVPFSLKLELANLVISNLNNLHHYDLVNNFYSQNLAYILRPAFLLGYSVFSLIYIIKKSGKTKIEHFNWVVFFLISMVIIAISFELLTFIVLTSKNLKETLLHSPFHFLTGLCFLSVPVSIITIFPEIIYGKKAFKTKKKIISHIQAENPLVDFDETQLNAERIRLYLETEKPYLNPNFNLQDLEKAVDIDEEKIRHCLKYFFNKKFTELRSEYRVNHAKELLSSGMSINTSIDGIGVLSGFSNRANFYATFKLFVGQTPTEYLKTISEQPA